jgi:hypothetical protein
MYKCFKADPMQGLTSFVTVYVSVAPSAVPYILPIDLQTHSSLTPNQLVKTLSDLYLVGCRFELRP